MLQSCTITVCEISLVYRNCRLFWIGSYRFAISSAAFHSIPCASETSFVCNGSCPPRPSGYSSFRVHFSQGDRRWPGRVVNLESLIIRFKSPLSRPSRERRRPLPPTRIILPALVHFEFQRVSEYLEDVVAPIEAPLIESIRITFFHQLIFDIPQLVKFMSRTTRFQALNEARLDFKYSSVQVQYLSLTQTSGEESWLKISCEDLDWQLSSVAQVFTSFFPSLHTMKHLYIYYASPRWQDDIENMQWLEIFHPFTAVKVLHVPNEFLQSIALALQELVGKRATPALERLFLVAFQPSGPVQEAFGKSIATRQLLGYPVAVSY